MIKFPNAKKAVSKIFASEILALIGITLVSVAALLAILAAAGLSLVAAVIATVLAVIGFILMGVGSIIELVGLFQGGKDSRYFSYGAWLIILAIVVSVISPIMSDTVMKSILSALYGPIDLIVMFFILAAVDELVPDSIAAKKGRTIAILAAIVCVITLCFSLLAAFKVIAVISAIAALVLNAVYYIMYLVFLSMAKKEL